MNIAVYLEKDLVFPCGKWAWEEGWQLVSGYGAVEEGGRLKLDQQLWYHMWIHTVWFTTHVVT